MPSKPFTLLLVAPIFSVVSLFAQQPLLQQQAIILKKVVHKNHYKARPVDDAFSADVFDRVIEKLDEYKLNFTAQDIAQLTIYRNKIDDEMNGQSWGFTNQLSKVYKTRLQKADSLATKILDKAFSFTNNESFSYSENQQSPQDDAEFALRWGRFLKWRVMSKLVDKYDLAKADSIKLTKADIMKEEPAARKTIKDRVLKGNANYLNNPAALSKMIGTLYLQTIATTYDPHTEFFPPEEKEAFQDMLSTQSMDFGFSLEENEDGELEIEGLVPGGAAWKSGNIHKDDKLLQIKAEGEAAIDVRNASHEEIKQILQNHANKKIQIVVQSADSKVNTIDLQRQQQRNEENIVKGFVLHGNKNIGYISLPSFYTSWNAQENSSCANDVAKEIIKLKKENIEGLILDLRYNGGGSMQEAADLAGIFIDIGPVSLIRTNDGKTFILKDPNRGTIYDEPLAVMINGQSASASELVAGTLQDYQRALIIGSNSFGKATMQGILPLDTTIRQATAAKPANKESELGYVKTTEGKLFRITNKTAQLNGVQPDVVLPDAFSAMDYTERSMKFALPSDTIIKNVVYTKSKTIPAAQLATSSSQRVAANPYFTNIKKATTVIKNLRKQNTVPLNWEAYVKWRSQFHLPEEKATTAATQKIFTIQNSAFDDSIYKLDDYQKEMNRYVIQNLSEDHYLDEAYLVMLDYLQSEKTLK